MNAPKIRVMVIRDLKTNDIVYGQIIHDENKASETTSVPSTNSVVDAYLKEFCSGCYVANSVLPVADDFKGTACTVAEKKGMREYAVVVKILELPVDNEKVSQYYSKEIEWNAARELHRGNPDPRYTDLDVEAAERDIFWKTFKNTFTLVCLAVLVVALVGTMLGDKDKT